ncbi:MAG: hypothetical protein GY906_36005 [bacterium]|nr:hypothetical protein [bacterium]
MAKNDNPGLEENQPFPSHLAQLAESHQSGVLVVSSRNIQREFHFTSGEVRAIRSTADAERLGAWLICRELISEDDRALSLLRQNEDEILPLGQQLVDKGLVEAETLDAELEELALIITAHAASEPHAFCEFREGQRDSFPDTLPTLTTTQIVLTAARAYPDIEFKRSAVGSFDQLIARSEALDAKVLDLKLNPTEGFLLSRLEGSKTLASLEAMMAALHDEMVTNVFTLITAGLVTLSTESSEPKKQAPKKVKTSQQPPPLPRVNEDSLLAGQVKERRKVTARAKDLRLMSHYEALDLLPGAPDDQIDAAWEAIQRRYNPQRAGEGHLCDLEDNLKSIMDRAEEAFDVLSNPSSRDRYDRILEEVEQERLSMTKGKATPRQDAKAQAEIVEANFQRADELIRQKEIYLAIQLLEQACALDPRPPELVKLARLMMKNPLWTNRALAKLKKAIQVDSTYLVAWLELAEFWRRRDDPERQRKALERALNADPFHEEANQMYRDLVGKRELDRLLRRANLRRS